MTDKYKNLIGSIRTLSDGIETRQEYDTLINKIKNIVRGNAAKGDDNKDPTGTRTNALRKSIQNNIHKKIDEEEKMAAKNFGLSQSLIDAVSRVAESTSTYQVKYNNYSDGVPDVVAYTGTHEPAATATAVLLKKRGHNKVRLYKNGKIVADKGLTKEEVEQIDELSPKTLGSYVKKATSSNDPRSISNLSSKAAYELATTGGGEPDDHKSFKRSASINLAVTRLINRLRKEEVEQKEESDISEGGTGNAMKTLQDKMRIMANLKGEPEKKKPEEEKKKEAVKEESDLEEGRRGRPPKVGSAAYAAQMANAQEDEPDQHIIMQLKKAADSTDKPHVITFKKGAKAVHHAIAQKALDRYMGQKTADKRKHQKYLATSHENLISYASGK
jgi:hypothetical protein